MDNEQIRKNLETEQARLNALHTDLHEAGGLGDAQQDAPGGETSLAGTQHPADVATDEQQREMDLSVLDQIEAELTDVQLALDKIDAGTYGVCEAGGEQIEPERLEALPATRFCAEHAGAAPNNSDNRISPI